MQRTRHHKPLMLTDAERRTLEEWARRPKTAQRLALRSRIVLGGADGLTNRAVAARLGASSNCICKWRERFRLRRLEGFMVFYRVLELAVAHDPVRYQDLIATSRPRAVRLTPPYVRGHPPSLERPPANRPWRIAALNWSG